MAVNALVTGLIVFRILKVFSEVRAAQARTSVERSLGSTGCTKFRHIMFILIESGMALFVIQLVRVVLGTLAGTPCIQWTPLGPPNTAEFVIGINQMFNVIIKFNHFYFFCFTDNYLPG